MCQTFYMEHDKCACIYIPAHFIPCAAYSLAHPEGVSEISDPFADPEGTSTGNDRFADEEETSTEPNPFADPEDAFADPSPKSKLVGQAARSKVLTQGCKGLNLSYDDIDYVSIDVDDSKAPKGVHCSEGVIAMLVPSAGGEDRVCWLCDHPDVLEMVEGVGQWEKERKLKEVGKGKGKGKRKEKEKGIFHKTAKIGTAAVKSLKSAVSGKAKKPDWSSAGFSAIGEEESSTGERAEKKEKKPKSPRQSMYMDPWGGTIAPWC